jgi:hypothetical protein
MVTIRSDWGWGSVDRSTDFGSPTTLVDQAPDTAEGYLIKAVRMIDEAFGEKGYAAKHPELVVGFMQVAAIDFATGMLTKAVMYHGEQIKDGLEGLKAKLGNDGGER